MWQAQKFLFYSSGHGEPLKVEQGSEMIKACLQKAKKERQTTKWTTREGNAFETARDFVCMLEKKRPVNA